MAPTSTSTTMTSRAPSTCDAGIRSRWMGEHCCCCVPPGMANTSEGRERRHVGVQHVERRHAIAATSWWWSYRRSRCRRRRHSRPPRWRRDSRVHPAAKHGRAPPWRRSWPRRCCRGNADSTNTSGSSTSPPFQSSGSSARQHTAAAGSDSKCRDSKRESHQQREQVGEPITHSGAAGTAGPARRARHGNRRTATLYAAMASRPAARPPACAGGIPRRTSSVAPNSRNSTAGSSDAATCGACAAMTPLRTASVIDAMSGAR